MVGISWHLTIRFDFDSEVLKRLSVHLDASRLNFFFNVHFHAGFSNQMNYLIIYFIFDKVGYLHREPAGRKEFSVELCSSQTNLIKFS